MHDQSIWSTWFMAIYRFNSIVMNSKKSRCENSILNWSKKKGSERGGDDSRWVYWKKWADKHSKCNCTKCKCQMKRSFENDHWIDAHAFRALRRHVKNAPYSYVLGIRYLAVPSCIYIFILMFTAVVCVCVPYSNKQTPMRIDDGLNKKNSYEIEETLSLLRLLLLLLLLLLFLLMVGWCWCCGCITCVSVCVYLWAWIAARSTQRPTA